MKKPKRRNPVQRHKQDQRQQTTPIQVARTLRQDETKVLTSMPAGKCVPIKAVPLLREDQVHHGQTRFSFEMHETAEILMNSVHVDVMAYLVPWLAFERFNGMDHFNKSYNGLPWEDGGDVTPFFETAAYGAHGANEIYKALGLHADPTAEVNTMILEAYNMIFNFRLGNRSPDLLSEAERTRLQTDLAPAFWKHNKFKHIVPDFDQAKIDGEVPLSIANAEMPVRGIGVGDGSFPNANHNVREATGSSATYAKSRYQHGGTSVSTTLAIQEDPDNLGYPKIFAELQDNGITVSLANIQLARETAQFASLRERYSGHSDEYIIDMLMDGLTIPDKMYEQPILVGRNSTVFGQQKRYAQDAGNLSESAVNGATFVDLHVNIPKLPTGGVIMYVAEITPEQLFERKKDVFFNLSDVEELPQFLRDHLDPEKVEIVTNDFVDVDHNDPTGTFGYAPLNHQWNMKNVNIGGDYFRPEVDAAFDEERQRLWAVETQNPTLGVDFYLCTNMHIKPFADQTVNPFECVALGNHIISGNTVFGDMLIEASNDYAKILEKAPTEPIDKDAA